MKGKRVAVQFETEPQNIVGPRDDMTAVTVLSPEEGMKALAEGRADAAFLWAPTAGYLNKTAYDGRFSIIEVEGPRLTWPAAIGYPKASASLRDSIDAVLPEVSKDFPRDCSPSTGSDRRLRRRASPPTRVPAIEKAAVVVAQSESPAPSPAAPAPSQTATSETGARDPGKPAGDGTGEFDVAPLAQPPTPEMIAAGKEVFNSICAHCHGPDAVQGVKKIDLRRLTLRYGDGAHNMYWKTVHEGRPAKGMPTWKGVFTDEQFEQIYAFLSSVQSTE